MTFSYSLSGTSNYATIKQILKEEFKISDRLILKLKTNQRIFINNELVSINHPVNPGDTLTVNLDFIEDISNIVPTKMDLNIAYEDDFLLIVNKPPFMATHPSMLHYENTLSNGIRYYFDSINLKRKIRPVNRLDKDTSGLVVFAKNEYIQNCLSVQMQHGEFKKSYLSICMRNF